jgi:hypothetical protein
MTSPRYWQLYGGRTVGGYAPLLVARQVALVGPGDPGDYATSRQHYAAQPQVQRMAEQVAEGDLIALCTRPNTVYCVGVVAGPYCHLPQFEDVNGADLQHARRVRWHTAVTPWQAPEPLSIGTSLLGEIVNPTLRDYVDAVVASEPRDWQRTPIRPLPPEEPPLTAPPAPLAELVAQAADLAPLYGDSVRFGEPPSEHEVVAHYVVPLLRALRWPAERVALEWRRTDVALFRSLPRTPENLHLIIEAKRLGVNVESKLQQATDYLRAIGVARDVIVTDGLRYRLYAAPDYTPVAYANLTRLKPSSLALFERLQRP